MRNLAFITIFLITSAFANQLQAQSLKNTAWKFYVEPLHDSLVMHIGSDTSYTTMSTGETVIRFICTTAKDTVKIMDFEGEYNCLDGQGVYKYVIDGDTLSFFLLSDPCNNRAGVLNGIKCKKAAVSSK